jgi:hypothetical protein
MGHHSGSFTAKVSKVIMGKILFSRVFWGVILVIGGGLLLLDTLGVFKGGDVFWTMLTAVAGILFLSVFVTNHVHWWALIPGIILVFLAAMIALNAFLPGFSNTGLPSALFLAGIGVSFLLVYLVERRNWWAIIPAGVMGTLAVVAALDPITTSDTNGGIFFLGLGLTFALVAVLPTSVGRMRWAWIPAAVLGIFGFILVLAAGAYLNYVWPAALLIVGFALIIRSIIRK